MEEQAITGFPSQTALDAVLSALQSGQETRLRVDGASMAPVLLPGDWVVVTTAPVTLSVGQVVLVRRDYDLVTHRLVARTREGWVTKGDALSYLDRPVSATAILGVVAAVERSGKPAPFQLDARDPRGRWLARLGRMEASLVGALQKYQPAWLRGRPWAARLARICRVPFRLGVKILSQW